MEKNMISKLGVPYKGVLCGKWRRYFSGWNFVDLFKTPLGVLQALIALARFRPTVIFCKGGYVSFPVAFAGWLLHIPVVLHESDLVPGLSNKVCAWLSRKVCVSFEESQKYFSPKKVVVTGTPVRSDIAEGDKTHGKDFTEFTEDLPVLLFMGGSQGAGFINSIVWKYLDRLLEHYQVVHICGIGKEPQEIAQLLTEDHKKYLSRYRSFGFVEGEIKHVYALADLIVGRSGANTLAEIDFIHKPAVLIPLGKKASRGDQIDNAEAFIHHHSAVMIQEEDFEEEKFFSALEDLLKKSKKTLSSKGSAAHGIATEKIIHLLESV